MKRIITIILMLAALLLFSACALAEAPDSKPSTEDLQEEARFLGPELIGGTARVIHTGNYRAKASQDSEKVGVTTEGEIYEIIGYCLNSDGRCWIQIDLEGAEVWVSASLVRCSVSFALDVRKVPEASLVGTEIRIAAGRARVREDVGTEHPTVAYVRSGQRYQVLDAYADQAGKIWYQIEVDGLPGWISSGLAENSVYPGNYAPVTKVYGAGSDEYPTGCRCTVIAESARARAGAGTEFDVVGYVYAGEKYTILSVATASNGRPWYQVKADDVVCWISSGVTELD
ncbi:MAG: SH3 domain-containing protein [Clostridia bacterium]|nr:SH3 domain-containing protein [Clostridia bacterium]